VTDAVLADWRTAPVSEALSATLGFLEQLTLRPDDVSPEGADAVRAAGVSHQALEDAVHVCALFNIIDRIADALAFHVPAPQDAEAAAPRFFERGYR
jgi:alkylhydroperoxidase family enzyme